MRDPGSSSRPWQALIASLILGLAAVLVVGLHLTSRNSRTMTQLFIPGADEWRLYSSHGAPPPYDRGHRNWIHQRYDDGRWESVKLPVGNGNEPRVTYGGKSPSGLSFHVRRTFSVGEHLLGSRRHLRLRVASDNCALVFLNGKVLDRDPEFDGERDHDFRHWNRERYFPANRLRTGENVMAAFVLNGSNSSDAHLDIRLDIQEGALPTWLSFENLWLPAQPFLWFMFLVLVLPIQLLRFLHAAVTRSVAAGPASTQDPPEPSPAQGPVSPPVPQPPPISADASRHFQSAGRVISLTHVAVLVLFLAGICIQGYQRFGPSRFWVPFTSESGPVPWFSALQLILVGVAALIQAVLRSSPADVRPGRRLAGWLWMFMGLGFIFLGCDEWFEWHDGLTEDGPLSRATWMPDIPFIKRGDVVLLGFLAAGAVPALLLLRELSACLPALVVFLCGCGTAVVAVVLDALKSPALRTPEVVGLYVLAEEGGEILAAAMFLISFVLAGADTPARLAAARTWTVVALSSLVYLALAMAFIRGALEGPREMRRLFGDFTDGAVDFTAAITSLSFFLLLAAGLTALWNHLMRHAAAEAGRRPGLFWLLWGLFLCLLALDDRFILHEVTDETWLYDYLQAWGVTRYLEAGDCIMASYAALAALAVSIHWRFCLFSPYRRFLILGLIFSAGSLGIDFFFNVRDPLELRLAVEDGFKVMAGLSFLLFSVLHRTGEDASVTDEGDTDASDGPRDS